MSTEDYCLRWEEGKQLSSVGPWSSSIDDLKNNEAFWDIKLVTEESEIKCHKFILGASSPHLRKIIQRLGPVMNPVIYLRGVRHADLERLVEFIYLGVVNVPQDGLESLLEVAEDLQVKGLTQENDKKIEAKNLPRAPPAKKFKPARRPSDSFEKSEELPEEKPIKKEGNTLEADYDDYYGEPGPSEGTSIKKKKKYIPPSNSSMIEVIAELVEKYELDKHTNAYRRKEIWELIHKDFVEQTGADHLQIFQVQKKWQNFMAEIKRNPNNEQNILASFDNPDHFMESSMVEDSDSTQLHYDPSMELPSGSSSTYMPRSYSDQNEPTEYSIPHHRALGHDIYLLHNIMEEKNFRNDGNPHNMKKQWIEITDEYNRQLGTNFTVAQVKNKRKNHSAWKNHKKSKMIATEPSNYLIDKLEFPLEVKTE